MSTHRYAARRDDNEPEIVDVFKAAGWSVHRISDTGFPDLVCAKHDRTILVEVIGEQKAKRYRKTGGLTPHQFEFHLYWTGKIYCVRSVEEAQDVIRRNV